MRSPDNRKETYTAELWPYFSFSKSSGLVKVILQGTVKGEGSKAATKVGTQNQGMDRSGDWKVPQSGKEQRRWTKLVAKSFVVPQDSSQVRD